MSDKGSGYGLILTKYIMNFKEWLEGQYGTSASGEIGGFNPVGPNSDEYVRKGIVSAYQQVNKPKTVRRPIKYVKQFEANISKEIEDDMNY